MNRQQRRKEGRRKLKELNKVHKVTAGELEKIRRDAKNDAITVLYGYLFTIPFIVLNREFKFGKKRLQKFNDLMTDELKELEAQRLDLSELMQEVKDKYGICLVNTYEEATKE